MGTTWDLAAIRTKVRALTGRKSTNHLSNNDLDDYINHFYMEDLIANLELEELDSEFLLYTTENVESYDNVPSHYTLSGKAFVDSDHLKFYKDYDLFFTDYAREYNVRESAGTGDGSTNPITGTLNNSPVAPKYLTFDDDTEIFKINNLIKITGITNADPAVVTSEVAHGLTTGDEVQIQEIDIPPGYEPSEGDKKSMSSLNNTVTTITKLTDTTFELDNVDSSSLSEYISGGSVRPISITRLTGDKGGTGSVTLSSGAFSLSFNTAVTDGQDVRATYESYRTGKPDAMLIWGDEIFLRPVPDGTYLIKLLAKVRPAPLISTTDALPENSWGKYIAYGASIDILLDSGQDEAANRLERQFERLRAQVESKRIKQDDQVRAIPRF